VANGVDGIDHHFGRLHRQPAPQQKIRRPPDAHCIHTFRFIALISFSVLLFSQPQPVLGDKP
jgi:hypothetical protein